MTMPLAQQQSNLYPTNNAGAASATPATIAEISSGLLARDAWTSPKYLYDALGSKLFEAICALPEYYPTRTEAAIFARHGAEIAHAVGPGSTLIDLGAGNCAKAASLFPLLHPAQYVAVDISYDFLSESLSRLQQRFPHIEMTGLGLDFSSRLDLPDSVRDARRLFFYPGSSIGNFAPEQATAFLRRLRANADGDGGLLIGVDLIKDDAILDAAYDDALGVTAAFNLNMLRHVNGLIGADFDVRAWQHHGFFNADERRVEMHLEARSEQFVHWKGGQRRFAKGERIHTEDSYKYTRATFVGLLEQAGFSTVQVWTDPQQWFAVIYARVIRD
ncbi:Histidine-specific methyltransferase EgtD [Janthinobacterium sp. KBS0711]|uniref:L-histidine N(alpha)-methyltransferase n=1 Tax=unclassified Janthinobacterium TaxID=2610881 RepID=UPI000632E771|nr:MULTISPECIES: L-histidine N(alpha)-methyltransferase [unclassified Janthinobacterium]KKO63991.1 Histidine-specific methyltransferase EgtD [Janthinobacterium sp. KBS0711]TSD71675.1 L-histidine N(alpha)-methyltransferase [Janthinobacterium sp. KBS0711]